MSLMRIFCILLLAVLHSDVASAQHRENNLQFQYQKRLVMDKNTNSTYHDWYHRSHYTISYDIPDTRFTPVATFEFYLKNGIKQCRFHGGTHITLTDKSRLSLQLFNVLVPGKPSQVMILGRPNTLHAGSSG